jgi:predicted metal-dependent HD superfamily phosphohydrolase
MKYQRLIEKADKFVSNYFLDHLNPNLFYHTIAHTKYVVKAAEKIGNHLSLNEEDAFIVSIAALFHDIGYADGAEDHESRSCLLATSFLEKNEVLQTAITRICRLIMSTTRLSKPADLLEEILADANLYHLGKETFEKKSELLRMERQLLENKEISKEKWRLENIDFLRSHVYYTIYCRVFLEEKKQLNLRELQKKGLSKVAKMADEHENKNQIRNTGTELQKNEKIEKGADTMFKITSNNSQRLSGLADNKAHILITVNSIILSAIISMLLRKLSENAYLMIPTLILLGVSLTSMIFAILSTRPALPRKFSVLHNKEIDQINLLFFGNFYHLKMEEYVEGMHRLMRDQEHLYDTLIKDVYLQGKVLGKKYFLLRVAYTVFMFGLIGAVLAFIIAAIGHDPALPLAVTK